MYIKNMHLLEKDSQHCLNINLCALRYGFTSMFVQVYESTYNNWIEQLKTENKTHDIVLLEKHKKDIIYRYNI